MVTSLARLIRLVIVCNKADPLLLSGLRTYMTLLGLILRLTLRRMGLLQSILIVATESTRMLLSGLAVFGLHL